MDQWTTKQYDVFRHCFFAQAYSQLVTKYTALIFHYHFRSLFTNSPSLFLNFINQICCHDHYLAWLSLDNGVGSENPKPLPTPYREVQFITKNLLSIKE